MDPKFPESKSKVLLKLCIKLIILVYIIIRCGVKAVSISPILNVEFQKKHAFVSEPMQQGQYWSVH